MVACGPKGPGTYDTFAQCLTENNLTMYGTEWCPHCQNQKELFEGSFYLVDYIDCDLNKAECINQGVTGYPAWKYQGEAYSGTRELQFFADLTGCELVEG